MPVLAPLRTVAKQESGESLKHAEQPTRQGSRIWFPLAFGVVPAVILRRRRWLARWRVLGRSFLALPFRDLADHPKPGWLCVLHDSRLYYVKA